MAIAVREDVWQATKSAINAAIAWRDALDETHRQASGINDRSAGYPLPPLIETLQPHDRDLYRAIESLQHVEAHGYERKS